MLSHYMAVLAATLFVAACESPMETQQLLPRDVGTSVALNAVWQLGTHNSYWAVHQGGDPFVSGPGERLLDQLLVDHVRSIEIDVHQDPARPHAFRVYHASAGDSLCDKLEECLGIVRTFQRTLPDHQPLLILIELLELFHPLFDDNYTIADFDRALADGLGQALYRPGDFMKPCAAQSGLTLSACSQQVGWPSIAELKGRVVVAALGNWDMFGGVGTAEWVHYSNSGAISERAAFPMATGPRLDWNMLDGNVQNAVSADEIAQAVKQSILFQSEDLNDPNNQLFLKNNAIIRIDNEFSIAQQEQAVKMGMHILQTDEPWIAYDDHGPEAPLRAFNPQAVKDPMKEPGQRLRLRPAADAQSGVFAYVKSDADSTLETTVSAGIAPASVGCVRAATSADGTAATSLTLCRKVLPNILGPAATGMTLTLSTCQNAACTSEDFMAQDGTLGGPGDILSMQVESAGENSCVTFKSARLTDEKLAPIFATLGDKHCVMGPLPYRGIMRAGTADSTQPVYFFHTTSQGVSLGASNFSGVSIVPASGSPAGLSDPSRLEDISFP